MDAIQALKTRRSVRKYSRREVPSELVRDIVDCGRLAATALNLQPWEFVVVTDEAVRRKIAGVAEHGKFIAEAPVCIAVFCRADKKYFLEDGSAATQNMLVAATAHGLGSCWVAGHKKDYAEAVQEYLGIPGTHTLVSLVAVGYAAGETAGPKKRSLEDVLHRERFGAVEPPSGSGV
ncbi:MAG: nitroreductase family protein [Candidatus Desulforudis sp.]|nr:nitroreductase family protein [Desulforudis sp.]